MGTIFCTHIVSSSVVVEKLSKFLSFTCDNSSGTYTKQGSRVWINVVLKQVSNTTNLFILLLY